MISVSAHASLRKSSWRMIYLEAGSFTVHHQLLRVVFGVWLLALSVNNFSLPRCGNPTFFPITLSSFRKSKSFVNTSSLLGWWWKPKKWGLHQRPVPNNFSLRKFKVSFFLKVRKTLCSLPSCLLHLWWRFWVEFIISSFEPYSLEFFLYRGALFINQFVVKQSSSVVFTGNDYFVEAVLV